MPTRVLIVDTDESDRLALARILKSLGCWCALAADQEQASDRLKEYRFEMAIVEIDGASGLGLDLLRHVRGECSDTAILAVTSVFDPLDADAVLEIGVYGYLLKPLTPTEVLIQVSCALRRRMREIEWHASFDAMKKALLEQASKLRVATEQLGMAERQLRSTV